MSLMTRGWLTGHSATCAATPQSALETTNRDPIAEAERYALDHSKRAALIGRRRRMQDKTDSGWVAPDIVQALVAGSRPILLAPNHKPQREVHRAS